MKTTLLGSIPELKFSLLPLPLAADQYAANLHILPDELKSASEVRKQEYIAGRLCAFKAASDLGIPLAELPRKGTRDPQWPSSIVGSISHNRNIALASLASRENYRSIGIDVEEIMPLQEALNLSREIATDEEVRLAQLNGFDFTTSITLIFSAKEAFFKAHYPIHQEFLEFHEAKLTRLDKNNKSFTIKETKKNISLQGKFDRHQNTVLTIVTVI